jgi:hypothetical protein
MFESNRDIVGAAENTAAVRAGRNALDELIDSRCTAAVNVNVRRKRRDMVDRLLTAYRSAVVPVVDLGGYLR